MIIKLIQIKDDIFFFFDVTIGASVVEIYIQLLWMSLLATDEILALEMKKNI